MCSPVFSYCLHIFHFPHFPRIFPPSFPIPGTPPPPDWGIMHPPDPQGDYQKHYGTTVINTEVPTTVYAIVDSRGASPPVPIGFRKLGETMTFTNGSTGVSFNVYSQDYEPGAVNVQISGGTSGAPAVMANYFVQRKCEGAWRLGVWGGVSTSGTASAHQPLGSANAEATPAGAPPAAADRKQRPDAPCEGNNG